MPARPPGLLLKAGTNSVGVFEFSRDNIVPVGWKLATEPHIVGGLETAT